MLTVAGPDDDTDADAAGCELLDAAGCELLADCCGCC